MTTKAAERAKRPVAQMSLTDDSDGDDGSVPDSQPPLASRARSASPAPADAPSPDTGDASPYTGDAPSPCVDESPQPGPPGTLLAPGQLAMMRERGYIVLHDVLDPGARDEIVAEIWRLLDGLPHKDAWKVPVPKGADGAVDVPAALGPLDKDTLAAMRKAWPPHRDFGGICEPPAFHLATVWRHLRQHPGLYAAYAALYGRPDLWVGIDRPGVKLPGEGKRGVVHQDWDPWAAACGKGAFARAVQEEVQDLVEDDAYLYGDGDEEEDGDAAPPKWTDLQWVDLLAAATVTGASGHAVDDDTPMYQGMVALSDNVYFAALPGSHTAAAAARLIVQHPELRPTFTGTRDPAREPHLASFKARTKVNLPDSVARGLLEVHVPAGAMIIWDRRLAHGILPNDDPLQRARQVIYHTYFPAPVADRPGWANPATGDSELNDRLASHATGRHPGVYPTGDPVAYKPRQANAAQIAAKRIAPLCDEVHPKTGKPWVTEYDPTEYGVGYDPPALDPLGEKLLGARAWDTRPVSSSSSSSSSG